MRFPCTIPFINRLYSSTAKSPHVKGIFFSMKEKTKHSDLNLSGVSKSPDFEKIHSLHDIRLYFSAKDTDFDQIFLRNQHLGLIQKSLELKQKIRHQNEIFDFIEIIKLINRKMQFLLIPKDHAETPLMTQKLMNNLIDLQDSVFKFLNPMNQECCFFLNIHFLRAIIREKNDLWIHKFFEIFQGNDNLQNIFEEMIDLLSFYELAYLITKAQKRQNTLEKVFKKMKTRFLSQSLFDEICKIHELNSFFLICQQNSYEITIDKKKIIIKFFNILKASDYNWSLEDYVLNSALSFIKKSFYDFEESLFLLNCIKEIVLSSKKGYDFFSSNILLLKAFANFFPSHLQQKHQVYLDFIFEFYEKNKEFYDFYSMCYCIDFLNERAFEKIKGVYDHVNIENLVEFANKTPDNELSRFFYHLSNITILNINDLLFKGKDTSRSFKDFQLKTNKAILLCHYLNPRDYHLYNFDIQDLRKFADNQFYVNRILSFVCYLSLSCQEEFLSSAMKNLEFSAQKDELDKFLDALSNFLETSEESLNFLKNRPTKSMIIQNRINNALRENSLKPNQFSKILRVSSQSEIIKLSEKHVIKYLKQNIYAFSLADLSYALYDLAYTNQLFPEINDMLQLFLLKRLEYLTARDLKHVMKAMNHIDPPNINFHFFQSFYDVVLSRATHPEYAPLITEYIYNQSKYDKKKQYALQTPINNLMKALKKSTYFMTLNKLAKLMKAFDRIYATFSESLKNDFRQLFSDEKLKNEVTKITAHEVAFVYISIFSYAFVEKTSHEMMLKLHEILRLDISLNRIKNFDIGRIISEMTLNFSNIKDNPELMSFLKEVLLPKIMYEEFYFMEKTKTKDIGLFILMFWNLSLLQIPGLSTEFINKFQKEIDNLVKQAIYFQERSLHSIHSPKFAKENAPVRNMDLRRGFKNIHLMQMYQGLTLFSCFLDNGEQTKEKVYIDEKLDFIKKVNALNKTPAISKFEGSLDSKFQEKVYFLLNEKIFEKKQNIKLEKQFGPFHADIFIEEPYNVVFECNGQQHYKAGKLKLNDIRKHEVLQKIFKTKVVELNYLEWNEKRGEEQINYLKSYLQK